jgi:hypothetical protein
MTMTVLKMTYLDDTGKYDNWAQRVRVLPPKEGGAPKVFDPLVLLGIGGATAAIDEWDAIGKSWSATLKKFSLPYFHASDFDAKVEPFRSLSDADRVALVTALVGCVREIARPFAALVRPEWYAYNYDEPDKRGRKEEAREHDPCFWWCLERAAMYSTPNTTNVVFAHTPKYVGRPSFLHDCFRAHHSEGRRLEGNLVTGVKPKDVVQLQVADLIVWGFYRLAASNELEGAEKLVWWHDRLHPLIAFGDHFQLFTKEGAERIYAGIKTLCG